MTEDNQLPIYQQVAMELEKQVRATMQPGDMLNSEISLAKDFGVNRHTLRRAVDQLIQAGMLVRQQGKGTQVVSNKIEYHLNPSGKFTRNLNKLGMTTHAVLLETGIEPAPDDINLALGLQPTEDTYRLTTLRFMDGHPVCVINHYLNPEYVPNIFDYYSGGSLHEFLANQYQLQLKRKKVMVSACAADNMHSINLRCGLNTPLMVIQSFNIITNLNNHPIVEVSVSHARSDRLQYQIDFDLGDLP